MAAAWLIAVKEQIAMMKMIRSLSRRPLRETSEYCFRSDEPPAVGDKEKVSDDNVKSEDHGIFGRQYGYMGFWLSSVAVILACVTFAVTGNAQVVYYGNSINGRTLANTALYGALVYDNRVMFPKSGSIVSIKKYFMFAPGYGAGNGGKVKFQIKNDDGTSNHLPGSTVLGDTVPISGKTAVFPVVKFMAPVSVTAGVWYHLVATNTDSSPTKNYVSMNDIWDGSAPGKVRNPVIPDAQISVSYKGNTGGWVTRSGFTSILDFAFSDGTHWGMGYMEMCSTAAGGGKMHTVSGANKVREVFTVSQSDFAASSLSVRVLRKSGGSPLTVSLVSPSGTTSATTNAAPLGGFKTGSDLGDADFVTVLLPVTLRAGASYSIELSAPSDTVYAIPAVRDGNASGYGFDKRTVFSDGWAEYNTGGSWFPWDTWGTPAKDEDLSFYFSG